LNNNLEIHSYSDHENWQLDGETYRYNIELIPDVLSTGLYTDLSYRLYPNNSPISKDIWAALAKLVQDYDSIWDMKDEEIQRNTALWDALDQRGVELAKRVEEALGGSPPVFYYSIYRQKYIYPDNGI
jgi:hypothetical protein